MPTAASDDLSTTSYALLGLLSIKPWTTYEMAVQMERGLGRFWPRARSVLYREPQRLVARGLAMSTRETVGRRGRTVYAITPEGRLRLAEWLRAEGEPPTLEWNALVKVFFAENAGKEDLLRTLNAMHAWSEQSLKEHRLRATSYLEGEGVYQQRAAILALTGGFLADFDALVGAWARDAIAIVAQWPDDVSHAEPDWAALQRVSHLGAERRSGPAQGSADRPVR